MIELVEYQSNMSGGGSVALVIQKSLEALSSEVKSQPSFSR